MKRYGAHRYMVRGRCEGRRFSHETLAGKLPKVVRTKIGVLVTYTKQTTGDICITSPGLITEVVKQRQTLPYGDWEDVIAEVDEGLEGVNAAIRAAQEEGF